MSQIQLPNNIKIGFHLSLQGGVYQIFKRLQARNCTAFQTFLGSPRSWKVAELDKDWVELFINKRQDLDNPTYITHTKYLINICSPNKIVREKSIKALKEEYLLAQKLKADFIILHMGSHPNKILGTKLMYEGLSTALDKIASTKPLLLLENTAGEKNDLGYQLEDIAKLINSLNFPVGLCFDTCHAFQAGYNLTSQKGRAQTIKLLKQNFSPNQIKVIHLNDSKYPFASKKDRHEHIFSGFIGAINLAKFLYNNILKNISVIFETPQTQGADNPSLDIKNLKALLNAFKKLNTDD